MNPLNINHIKVEKAIAIKLRYQKLRKITNFFRVFEIFLVLAVISRISFHLPLALAFKLSNEYFHSLSLILVSPQFVFVLGNAIVITLFVNSGQFNTPCNVQSPKTPPTQGPQKRNTKLQPKKQGIPEENPLMTAIFPPSEHQVVKVYHRSKSEKVRREKVVKNCCELRRSQTEIKSLKGCASGGRSKEAKDQGHYPEDHMSNDEFRRTIEDFIAKQQKFLRQEEDLPTVENNLEF